MSELPGSPPKNNPHRLGRVPDEAGRAQGAGAERGRGPALLWAVEREGGIGEVRALALAPVMIFCVAFCKLFRVSTSFCPNLKWSSKLSLL